MIADIFGMDRIVGFGRRNHRLANCRVVLFGSSQPPKSAKNIGSAGREIRRAHQEADGEVVPVADR